MATYTELRDLFSNSVLLNRIQVGCLIAAEAIRTEDGATENHANRLVWAKEVFTSPKVASEQMLMAVLAANSAATVEQITGSTDETLQTKINAAVNMFADGS